MEIKGESRGALFERLAEQIDTPNHNGQRLRDSFAAAALSGGMIRIHCWHPGSEKDANGSIALLRVPVERGNSPSKIKLA